MALLYDHHIYEPGSSVHGNSPGKNTGVVCHFLFQGIFLTQVLNPIDVFKYNPLLEIFPLKGLS